ncbi:MAG: adenylate kinase [Streptococcaceae bacterium]|jgi:adenylate kinase|nr:adenylate kinase [Streptococcaceae bacterium]
MNLFIMGLPGAGKGTQAEMIVRDYGVVHVSTGDMFRAAMKEGTPMGLAAKTYIDKGELVPDEVTDGIVKERLAAADIRAHGFLLDGYPRNFHQAEKLDEILSALTMKLDAVINIDVNPEILVARISGRFICRKCGATYHKIFKKPLKDYTCDVCGACDFYQRADDVPETVENRIEINQKESAPVLKYYVAKSLVKTVEGSTTIEQTTSEVKAALDVLK